jgi:peptide/nickel transport system substrate-binding protein
LTAAVAASLAIAGCGGASHESSRRAIAKKYGTEIAGSLPAVGTPARGGTITVGQLKGQTPSSILPLIDIASCSTPTFNFVQNQYIPLYAGPDGAEPKIDESLSAAESPRYSDGDRTVTITIKPGLKWSDGKPVDAENVIFYLALLKAATEQSPNNWCQYSPGDLPDNLASWTTSGARTVVLHLTHAVNPNWFSANQLQDAGGGLYPLPSQDWNVDAAGGTHITDWATNPADALRVYDYLHIQGKDVATFASNPLWKVVDGPFKLKDFDAENGSYDLVPNPSYGLEPKAYASDISVRTYASPASMLDAMETHSLEVGTIESGPQLLAIPRLGRDGYSVFGGPGWGWFGGIINFRDTTNDFDKVVAQSYIRGVFAELVNQPEIIKTVYHGWAVPAYGPVPTAPFSPFVSADAARSPYSYNPAEAVDTLKAHGWKVRPGGQTTCVKPGTASSECGAGIPAGTPIKFVWANPPTSVSTVGALESQAFAGEAKRAAGIDVSFVSKTFSSLIADYDDQDPAAAKYVNDWGVNNYGGVYTDYYPTQEGLMNSRGALNIGAYDDPAADRRMQASVASPSAAAIVGEVSYLSRSYPIFYMPDQDWVTAVSKKIGGAQKAFLAMTQQRYAFQFLYRDKRK